MTPPSGSSAYPGTPEHRRLLRAIAEHYATDERVLAFCVFGSLGRGTWDEHSDLDLDVVITDGVALDPPEEVRRLCRAIGEEPVVVPDRDDATDVVLTSLLEFSIRYPPLQSTKVNIVESLVVLAGPLDHATIVAAGRKNQPPPPSLADLVGACVRHAVTCDAKLQRRAFWLAYLVLHEEREGLLRLYAACHGGQRPYHALDTADPALRARFGRTLPADDLPSLQRAFLALLDLLEQDLDALSGGQAHLTDAQRQVLVQLRARHASLDLGAGQVFLETERLLLRRFTETDVDNLCALDADPEVMHFITGGQPTPRAVIEQETLPRFLDYYRWFVGYGFFAAIEKSSGAFLGWFHFRPRPGAPPDEVELGYRLHRSAWGQGYGTEGSRALIRKGFAELGVRRVVAETMVVNTASRRVMEKSGLSLARTFHQEWPYRIPGDEQGDVEYALDRAEWERQERC